LSDQQFDLSELIDVIVKWCVSENVVRKAFVYGSRVAGTHGTDSDIDVAIELNSLPSDSSEFVTWMGEAERLRKSLAPLLPVRLHLEWYGGAVETPYVHKGLASHSILIYSQESM
jgi:predicted nucleotidyltransferase